MFQKGNLFVCPPVPYMLHFYIYLCGTESMLKNYPETVVLSVLYSTGGIVQDIPFCNFTTMYLSLLSGSFYTFLVPEIHETLVTLEISL